MIDIYDYVAISIDFEGTIGLTKTPETEKTSDTYRTACSITNTSRELLVHFQRKIGFGRVVDGSISDRDARLYVWRMSSDEIREKLSFIEPFLSLKREQAQLLIKANKILKSKKEIIPEYIRVKNTLYTEEEYFELESIYKRITYLNLKPSKKRGPLTEAEKLYRELRRR